MSLNSGNSPGHSKTVFWWNRSLLYLFSLWLWPDTSYLMSLQLSPFFVLYNCNPAAYEWGLFVHAAGSWWAQCFLNIFVCWTIPFFLLPFSVLSPFKWIPLLMKLVKGVSMLFENYVLNVWTCFQYVLFSPSCNVLFHGWPQYSHQRAVSMILGLYCFAFFKYSCTACSCRHHYTMLHTLVEMT